MSLMVPTTSDTGPHLDAVLPSCVAAVRGGANVLGLRPIRAAIVVVVDGLGASALAARRGHARTLAGALTKKSVITTGVPTTTAAALTTLMTGTTPGEHGIVSFSAVDGAGHVVSQLSGWGPDMDPMTWQRRPTLFERLPELKAVAVGPGKYRTSGFTRAILRGADYVAADDLAGRFDAALDAVARGARLVYLYIPEADQAAHAEGWQSDRWTTELEDIDGAVATALPRLPRDVALLVTADHGIVDVPAHRQVLFDETPELVAGVRHVAGEPRLTHLHLAEGTTDAHRDALLADWRRLEGERAWILTRDEAIAAGWFGPVDAEVAPRIGDVLVAARGLGAYYDTRTAGQGARAMVGQHGSWLPEETRIPLLRFGAAR